MNDDIVYRTGFIGIGRRALGGSAVIPAIPFMQSATVTLDVSVAGSGTNTIRLHFRAIPTLEFVRATGGDIVPRGAARVSEAHAFHVSGDSWDGIQWWDNDIAAMPVIGASPVFRGGTNGDFVLTLHSTPPDPTVTRAQFSGMNPTVPDADLSELLTGASQPTLYVDDTPPAINIEVISRGSTLSFPITVSDSGAWFAKEDVTLIVDFAHGAGGSETSTLGWNNMTSVWEWTVDPATFAAPVTSSNTQPVDGITSPIAPLFHPDYAIASQVVDSLTWPGLSLNVPAEYDSVTVTVSAADLVGNSANAVRMN